MSVRLRHSVAALVLPVVLVMAYQQYALARHSLYFPTLPHIADAFRQTWSWHGLRINALPSLQNLFVGYGWGLASALVVGVVVAQVWWLRTAVEPILSFFLALPAVALLPIFLIVFGIGAPMHQFLIAQAVFFQVLVNTVDGMAAVDGALLESADVFGIRGWRRLLLIRLPAAAPQILGGARAALSIAVLVMIVSELVGSVHGIGVVILTAQDNFEFPVMWAGMVFAALLGIILNYLFTLLERPFIRRSGLLATKNG